MIIWRGWGLLAAVLFFGGLVLAQLVADGIGGEGTYASNIALFAGIGLVVGGAATYALSRWRESRNPPRRLVDPATGGEVILHDRNDLFFIPIKIWGFIGMGGGAVAALAGLFGVAG